MFTIVFRNVFRELLLHKILNIKVNLDEVEYLKNFSYLDSTGAGPNSKLKLRIARRVKIESI